MGRTNEDSQAKPRISVSFYGERLLPSPPEKSSVNFICLHQVGGSSCHVSVLEAQSWLLLLENWHPLSVVAWFVIGGRKLMCGAHFLLPGTLFWCPLSKHWSAWGRGLVDILRVDHLAPTVRVLCWAFSWNTNSHTLGPFFHVCPSDVFVTSPPIFLLSGPYPSG